MSNPIDIPLDLRTCFSCPHCNKEDSEWNADTSEYMTYCLKKEKYCIENTGDPICTEREEELLHRFDTLDDIFVPYYDRSLDWLKSHGFTKIANNITDNETFYRGYVPNGANGACVTVQACVNRDTYQWRADIIYVKEVHETPKYRRGAGEVYEMSKYHLDVRDCMMDILPKLKELLG